MQTPEISIYNGVKDNTGKTITVAKALAAMSGDKLKKQVLPLRLINEKKTRNALKAKLPAVTWSGLFSERNKSKLIKHSGLICIDIDDLGEDELPAVKQTITQDSFLMACFISPSGNGLKLLFKIEVTENATHEFYFRCIADYLKRQHNLQADESGKDVSRLCFLSYDADIYIAHQHQDMVPVIDETIAKKMAATAPAVLPPPPPPAKPGKKQSGPPFREPEGSAADKLDQIKKFTDNVVAYTEGSWNKYLNQFMVNCKHQGIEEHDAEQYFTRTFSDYEPKLVKNVVKSVYANTSIEFGKHAGKSLAGPSTRSSQRGNAQHATPVPASSTDYNTQIIFWYETATTDKKTGDITTEVKFDHDKITYFLHNNGFRKISVGEGYQFIRVVDNKIDPVTPENITHFLLQFLSQNLKADEVGNYVDVEDALYQVRKMFKRGMKTYCSAQSFQSLHIFTPNFVRDTEHTAYLYFKNCFVEVTKEGITTKQYSELRGHIWRKQIIQREFTLVDREEREKCVFQRFISMAIIGDVEHPDEKHIQKFRAAITGVGYQLHRFKDSTNAKAVVAVDKKLRHSNESNGGSGKSLYFKAISKVVHGCILNGKKFKFDQPYPFETLNIDHGLVVFNDVKKNFDFEELFHYITEDWDYAKKYVDAIVIPFEESPKIGVATNFSLKGNGDSFIRRQHVIEFSNYFNAGHDPLKEFKHRFFSDWDKPEHEGEWNRFYNFMLQCVREFLQYGLIEFPLENYGINKLIDAMSEEGVDWLEDNINADAETRYTLGKAHNRAEIFAAFKKDLPQFDKMNRSNTFTGWLKEWCKIKGYDINKHKNGDNDKSGPDYFLTFTISQP